MVKNSEPLATLPLLAPRVEEAATDLAEVEAEGGGAEPEPGAETEPEAPDPAAAPPATKKARRGTAGL